MRQTITHRCGHTRILAWPETLHTAESRAFLETELCSECHARIEQIRHGPSTLLLGCHGNCHAIAYLLGIGTLAVLERTHPLAHAWWEPGSRGLRVDLPQEVILDLLCRHADERDWRGPTHTTKSLPLCATARRDPAAHVCSARDFLGPPERTANPRPPRRHYPAHLTREQVRRELRGVLLQECVPYVQPAEAFVYHHATPPQNYSYCLGTVAPNSVSSSQSWGEALSAWHAVLAGESRCWIPAAETLAESFGWVSVAGMDSRAGEWGRWLAPIWTEPRELRRCRAIFRPRGKHTPRTWGDWLRLARSGERRDHDLQWLSFRLGRWLGAHSLEMFGPLQPVEVRAQLELESLRRRPDKLPAEKFPRHQQTPKGVMAETAETDAAPQKRRGRPKGSKNKAKVKT